MVNTVNEDKVSKHEYRSIKKSGNKIVEILAKLKNQNLSKFRFENLFKSKKAQSASVMQEFNFLILNV